MKGLLAEFVEFAGTNVSLDLLVPKLGLIFPEPTAKLEDLRWGELLNLINYVCRTHAFTFNISRASAMPAAGRPYSLAVTRAKATN